MGTLQVFDIQRFALHDGPGIRTTVFVKGCPLDCLWCHNPESKRFRPQLSCLYKNCTGCGRCAAVCPKGVHTFDEDGKHHIAYDRCIQCGACVAACYNKALKLYGQAYDTHALVELVVRDRDFYVRSGGGLTVSGGEPMSQFEGLMALLSEAKSQGLHTCLDTSGFAPTEKYAAVMEYVDLFLYDYKLTDPQKHKQYTGADNVLIRQNIDYLCTHGARLFLRCPVIPGINDDEAHFEAIAALSHQYDAIVQVNVMAYHDMAKSKAVQIGEKYALADVKTVEKGEKRTLYQRLEALGCLRLFES